MYIGLLWAGNFYVQGEAKITIATEISSVNLLLTQADLTLAAQT